MSEVKKAGEVHKLQMREEVEKELIDVGTMPEKTDVEKELKRIRLTRAQRLLEQAQMAEAERDLEEQRIGLEELRERRKQMQAKRPLQVEGEEGHVPQPQLKFTLEEWEKWSKMPEDQRNNIMQAMVTTNATARASGGGGVEGLLIPLMLYQRNKPEAGIAEMIAFAKALVETAKALQPQQTGNMNVDEIVKMAFATAEKAYGKGEPQQGFWEQVMNDEAKFTRLKELFGGGRSEEAHTSSVEMQRILKTHELDMAKLNKDHEYKLQELGVQKEKVDALAKGGERIARAIGRAVGEGEQEGAEGEEARETVSTAEAGVAQQKCETEGCGAVISFTPSKETQHIKCAKCDAVYDVPPM